MVRWKAILFLLRFGKAYVLGGELLDISGVYLILGDRWKGLE